MHRFLRVFMPVVALLLLAAHFLRAGLLLLTGAAIAAAALAFVARPWATRLLQALLLVGTLEWLRTAWILAAQRMAAGQPYGRMMAIVGTVAALTLAAAVAAGRSPGQRASLGE